MAKYWNWYEVELERAAHKLLPERRAEILESLREHVAEATAELTNNGRLSEEAERLAIKNLGSPADLVAAELEAPRRQWLPVWIAGIGTAWCAAWLIIGSLYWTMQMILPALFLTPIGIFVATLYSRKTNVWALGGVTAGIGVVALAVVCFTWLDLRSAGGMGVTPIWSVRSVMDEMQSGVYSRTERISVFRKTWDAYRGGDAQRARAIAFVPHRGWKAPTGFWGSSEQVEYEYFYTFAAARKAWTDRGGRILTGLESRLAQFERNLSALIDPRARNPKAMFLENGPAFTGVAIGVFSVLAGSHALALLLIAIPRFMARRRWRVAL